MKKRILLIMAIGSLFIKEAFSLSLQQLIESAKARHRKFEETTKDLTILQEVTTFSPSKKIISEIKFLRLFGLMGYLLFGSRETIKGFTDYLLNK